jgi:MGT family glycosyltransferase
MTVIAGDLVLHQGDLLMPLRFLLASWGNPGNLTPFLTAARRLRQKGHRVCILDEPQHRVETERAGFEGISWRRPPKLCAPAASDEHKFWPEARALFEQTTFGAAIDYAADTMDALRSEPVDAVLTNDLLAGPAIAAEAAGIPYALLTPHISVRPLDGVPTCVTGLVPDGSPEYHAAEQAARMRLIELLGSHLPTLNRARAAFGLTPLHHIYEHYDRADRVMIGMSAAFDFPATRLPANLRYIGPLLDMPEWAGTWTAPWSESNARPRVLVSLSTSFQNQAALLRRIIAALGTMELDAVVTTGPAMSQESFEAPANVTILPSAPHDVVMKEVSLVITHGGHGTVTRALTNGVPLLVIPMGRDQGDNAVRVVARGAGLSLAESAAQADIAFTVRRLIGERHFRIAAQRLGEVMAFDLTSPALVIEMEEIATHQWRRSA